MARPKKPDSEHRLMRVNFRVSEAEMETIQAAADRAGMRLSEYARQVSIRGNVIVRQGKGLSPETFAALQRVGVNLNQLARAANDGRGYHGHELAAVLDHINTLLAEGLADGST